MAQIPKSSSVDKERMQQQQEHQRPSNVSSRVRSLKRNRHTAAAASSTSDWLNVVLNQQEVDPRPETVGPHELRNMHVSSRHKPSVSDNLPITTPFVFKPVNPGQGYSNGESSRSPGKHSPCTPSSSSVSFSSIANSNATSQLTEEQVSKVVQVLGETLNEVKAHVWRTVIDSADNDRHVPPTFLRELNKIYNDTPPPNPNTPKPPHIKSLAYLRSELSKLQHGTPLLYVTQFYQSVFDVYCQMTAFLSVCHMFFEVVVTDFLSDRDESPHTRRKVVEKFMTIFHQQDNFLLNRSFTTDGPLADNEYGLDAFLWYYRRVIRVQLEYPCHLQPRLEPFPIRFNTPDSIESILSMFYTKYFLNVFAKEHQKDHGQFYTPREVMRFMWDRVLLPRSPRDASTWLEKLLRGPPTTFGASPHPSRLEDGFLPFTPRVLDPCMGIGSFLCEYINRLTFAAQQLPSVWHQEEALSHLLQSLANNLWGIEIDPFALLLCKLNIILHMLPIYKRLIQISLTGTIDLPRLNLFCNDTLNLYRPKEDDSWEFENLTLLRSPNDLKFDYIVTNPPYMIRKTGFISEPDSELFDERVLGKGGMQAYAYFFWFCVERCQEEYGEVCLISASQWMGLEFADKLRAWLWQRCHLVEFFQFEPFKVWRKIQTDSLIFRLRRRREPIPANIPNGSNNNNNIIMTSMTSASSTTQPFSNLEPSILFLRYMNRKASLQETLHAYSQFNPQNPNNFDKDMHYKLTPPYPTTVLPSSTNSYSFTFLMPTSAVSAYLHSITANLPSLCDHSSLKTTWHERNPLIWHRGPNTNPVYALVVRTAWAYSKFGTDVCQKWLRPVFYWNGKNGGKEAEFWQKMGDELRLEKKESSPAEAYVPLSGNGNNAHAAQAAARAAAQEGRDQERSVYSLIMVDRDAIDKVRREVGEDSEFWYYLKEARIYLQAGMTSREIVYCGTSKCGVDVDTKIIHPINYGYFSKNQPRQRFFIDENNVCVTNQCIYFTLKGTTRLPSYFFLGLLNSTTIQHFLSHHCKYDQQGRMRLFRESMAKIPYAPPDDTDAVDWFVGCVDRMISVRKMLLAGVRFCDDEDKVSSAIVERLRRGAWQLTGREWQEKEREGDADETSVVLREEQDGNWVMVKKCRGRGDGVEYSLYPEAVPRFDELADRATAVLGRAPASMSMASMDIDNVIQQQQPQRPPPARSVSTARYGSNKTRALKPFFESLLHVSACLQYGIDQYVYSLYGIDPNFQIALEEDLKLEIFEVITTTYPRLNGSGATGMTRSSTSGMEPRGKMPEWGERLIREAELSIEEGRNLLQQKGVTVSIRRNNNQSFSS